MLWQGQVLWGMMVYDSLRAIDVLADGRMWIRQRIATLGMSMGSTMAWWLAALDERVKVTVDICCLTDFQTLLANKALRLHGVYYYVPSLLEHFTTAQINALIAPRRASRARRPQGRVDAGRGARHHRTCAAAGVCGGRASRTVEAAPVRCRTPGNRGRTAGNPRVPPTVPLDTARGDAAAPPGSGARPDTARTATARFLDDFHKRPSDSRDHTEALIR